MSFFATVTGAAAAVATTIGWTTAGWGATGCGAIRGFGARPAR